MSEYTQPIRSLPTQAAPLDYTVTGDVPFTVMAVRAVFDGSGGAAAFLPVVQLLDGAGNVVNQNVGSSVAAGGAADVTFFPGLTETAGGTTPTSTAFQILTFGFNIPSTQVQFMQFTASSGSSLFDVSGVNTNAPSCLVPGVYAVSWTVFLSASQNVAGVAWQQTFNWNPGGITTMSYQDTFAPNATLGQSCQSMGEFTNVYAAGDTFQLAMGNSDQVNAHNFTGTCAIQTV